MTCLALVKIRFNKEMFHIQEICIPNPKNTHFWVFDEYVTDSVSPKRDSPLLAVICLIWQVRHCSSSRTSAWIGHLFMSISTAPIISEFSSIWIIRTVICNDIVVFFVDSVTLFLLINLEKRMMTQLWQAPWLLYCTNLAHGRGRIYLSSAISATLILPFTDQKEGS